MNAECRSRGWTLLIRVTGFGTARCVVLELRRGTSVNVRTLTEVGAWRVSDRVWLQLREGPAPCLVADEAAVFIRKAMDSGKVQVIPKRKAQKPGPDEGAMRRRAFVALTRRQGQSNRYLAEEETRDS